MKITIENTPKIATLVIRGEDVPARVWQGTTESGVPVHCFVTRIVPEVEQTDPRHEELTAEFEQELQRCADPTETVQAIPLRFFID